MKTSSYIYSMQKIENFLQQLSCEQIRQSVLDIDDSYSNDWDILAELLQNSVDAIRKTDNANDGQIEITVDCQNHLIKVVDNGIGIQPLKLQKLLSLFGTDKKGDDSSVGEKGVGLKFAMFSCNDFKIITGNDTGSAEAIVKDALIWKMRTEEVALPLEYDTYPTPVKGTQVILNKVNEDHPLFELTIEQLIYILRTKTAIGNTNTIWDSSDIRIKITLNYISPDGKPVTEIIPFQYWLPIDGISDKDKINLDDYLSYVKEADRDNDQKRNQLKNKVVYWERRYSLNNRDIKAICCVVPTRATWDSFTSAFELASEEQLKDDIWRDKFGYATYSAGIFMSVKGMPTGINIEHPTTGAGGTWAQIFLMFEDRKLKFDIGRKSIHGKTKNTYKELARKMFNEYQNNVAKYVSGSVSPESTPWEKDEIFKEIESLIDLNSKKTSFVKTPRSQEGTVAALFFEAIGSGLIKDIKPLIAGYKNKYDLYALWDSKRVVIEFKNQLYKILKDWNDEVKMFTDIDCVVCWDVSEEDIQSFKDSSIVLEPVEPDGLINKNLHKFPHATHVLRYSGFIKPIYIIDMKIIVT